MAEISLVPSLDQLPVFWAAELGQAAPAPHIVRAQEPHILAKDFPHQQLENLASTCPLSVVLAVDEGSR